MIASTLPILDPRVASDHLLDARAALQDVRDSTLAGDGLNHLMTAAIANIDDAMKMIGALITRRVEQRRVDVEQLGEAS